MAKLCVFNGRTDWYLPDFEEELDRGMTLVDETNCPLKEGQVVEISEEIVHNRNIGYVLKGYPNQIFNIVWFTDLKSLKPTKLGWSFALPTMGERYNLIRVDADGSFHSVNSSPVQSVQVIGQDTLKVETMNTIYVVQLRLKD